MRSQRSALARAFRAIKQGARGLNVIRDEAATASPEKPAFAHAEADRHRCR